MVQKFKSKSVLVGRARLSGSNPIVTTLEGKRILDQMLVLTSMFFVVVVINIITIIICRSKSNQREIILIEFNLTITSPH